MQRPSLVAFIRAELKPNPSASEQLLTSHVRDCAAKDCPHAICREIKPKLEHLELCPAPACMRCASARLAYLAGLGLLSQTLVERFVSTQTAMIKSTVVGASPSPAAAAAADANYPAKRQAFVAVLTELHQIWLQRTTIPTTAATCTRAQASAQDIDTAIKRTPQAKQVLHAWEEHSKRPKPATVEWE